MSACTCSGVAGERCGRGGGGRGGCCAGAALLAGLGCRHARQGPGVGLPPVRCPLPTGQWDLLTTVTVPSPGVCTCLKISHVV